MSLPINIHDLLNGKVVEWERLEFKEGWNPNTTLHTICAFANDINNWGGGYVVIGVKENNGIPEFPPKGLPIDSLDRIQGEIIQACYTIQATYLPIVIPYEIDGKHILIIWCPAGDLRPYSCPSTLGNDGRRQFYIRVASKTILAVGTEQIRLLELTAKIPFDDRINQEASIKDLDLGLIREFLQEVGSDLFDESVTMPFLDLCKAMQIMRGPVEAIRPVNIGLLFFNKEPHNFFKRAWIELVIHDDESGRNYKEKIFKGPIHRQLRDCMAFLNSEILFKNVQKVHYQAESLVTMNYPYNALEEAISNAIYHKNYSEEKPIEIQIFPDRIEILSFPGPLPPITNNELQQRRVLARDYRNRRIGDFLKELKLTEGKATGIPLITDEFLKNGNPNPIFYTDKDKTLFLVTLPCHLLLISKRPIPGLNEAKVTKLIPTKVTKLNEEKVTKLNELKVTKINEEKVTKINEEKVTKIDEGKVTKIDEGKVTKINEEKVTKINEPKVTKLNEEKVTKIDEPKVTKIIEPKVTKLDEEKVTKLNELKVTKINKEKVTKINKEKVTKIDEGKVTKINEEKVTKIDEEKVTKIDEDKVAKLDSDISDIKDYVLINDFLDSNFDNFNSFKKEKKIPSLDSKRILKKIQLIQFLSIKRSRSEIFKFLKLDNQTKNYNSNLKPLIELRIIEMIYPEKPNSKLQKYQQTEKAKKITK